MNKNSELMLAVFISKAIKILIFEFAARLLILLIAGEVLPAEKSVAQCYLLDK